MRNIYYISGLGVDERVFAYLHLDGDTHTYIKWIKPNRNESIESYTQRLSEQVVHTEGVILVGVSFGGIIAQELARLIHPCKTVVISSITDRSQLEWKLKVLASMRLHRLVPNALLKLMNGKNANMVMGPKNKEEKELLKKINKDSAPSFTKWAIDKIVGWKGNQGVDVIHIHGTHDKIFPISKIKSATKIVGGEHFMVVSNAEEISTRINEIISSI